MTRLSWDFTGHDPAPGDPTAYARLSRDLADTAEAAESAYRHLARLATGVDETIWRGSAADVFAEELAELPPQLEKLQRSYALAAEAMATYGRVLEDLQYQAVAALGRLEQASAEETAGRRARDQALAAAAADPLALVPPETSALDRVVDDAGDRVRITRTELERIAEDRRAAESRAVAGLQAASDAGIANDAWHERALAAVGSWVDDHADILEELSGALQVVSGIAGVLSFIPVLAPVFAPIALASGAAALGIDAALVATGNGDWKSIAIDAGLMALPGAGKLVSTAARTTRASAAGRSVVRTGTGAPGLSRQVNFMEAGDDFATFAQRTPPLGGYTDVIIHGSPHGFARAPTGPMINHQTLARMLSRSPDYTGGPIRLLSCSTGAPGATAAQNLARKVGVEVLAPSDTLWAFPSGRLTIGPNALANTGEWVQHLPKG